MKKILILKNDKKRSQLSQTAGLLKNEIDFVNLKYLLPRDPKKFSDYLLLVIISPILFLYFFISLFFYRFKSSEIILTTLNSQLIITLPAKILGYKIYWYINDFYEGNFSFNILSVFYRMYSRLAKIICNSESVKDYLAKKLKIKDKRIILIKRGFDPVDMLQQEDIFADMSENKTEKFLSPFILGFIGDLKKENGLEYLIKAVDFLKDLIIDFQIIIIGDGPEKRNLHWLVKTLGYGQRVRFVGNQANIKKWYRHFQLLIVPRIAPTNFANTAAEAMSIGVPVVGFNIAGVSEVVNHQGGILVEPKNAEALAKAILELYNNKELRERFGAQGKSRINFVYSTEKMKEEYEKLFLG